MKLGGQVEARAFPNEPAVPDAAATGGDLLLDVDVAVAARGR